jgi:hypothetical protein
MATDKTAFDDFLKAKLYRDIGFRIVVWASISGLTAYYASRHKGFTTVAYLQKVADALMPVVNVIAVTAILMSGAALILKDLEHVAPATWGQSTWLGRIGGSVRRIAGDLGLWVIGALVTLLSAVTIVAIDAYRHGVLTGGNLQAIFVMYFVFIIFLALIALLNTVVRRSKPLVTATPQFAGMLTTAPRVIGFYAALLVVTYVFR